MNRYKYIMLIDDNEVDNLMHKKVLNVMGVAENIISFLNGLEAINYFRILTEINVSPYLIFLDLNMPKMDGFKFISEYQKLPPDKRKGRIVILSSSNNEADIKRAASLGITDYIIKPLTLEKVKNIFLTDAIIVPALKK